MLSGVLERKIYSEELKIVSASLNTRPQTQSVRSSGSAEDELAVQAQSAKTGVGALSAPQSSTKGATVDGLVRPGYAKSSYPVTVARLKKNTKISRRTRIKTFAQVRLGLREDLKYQITRVKSKANRRPKSPTTSKRGVKKRPSGA